MSLTWFLIRGSGLVAYGLLAVSTIWGLLLSTKVLGRAAGAKSLAWSHESLGLASVAATGVHLGALVADNFMHFGWSEMLVPGVSTYAPLGVALGISAFYGLVVVAVSFYVKPWIGQRAWRTIHYLSFGSFAAAAGHGIMAGTDSGGALAVGLYLVPAVVAVMLLVVRIAQALAPEPARPVRRDPTALSSSPGS